jgi:SOS-response transcriptional repressor LexA
MSEKQTTPLSAADVPAESTLRPTKKQKELLAFIEAFIAEHGYSPSYREIMNGLQYTSVATVALHVGNLIKRGHLRKRDHSARSLEVVTRSDTPLPTPLKTNQVKDGEEKWLVGKVEQLFAEAEAGVVPSEEQLENLYIMLGALRVLGLNGAAQSFMERLGTLKAKLAGEISDEESAQS